MKNKILIGLIIILFLALFVETAYLLQLKSDKENNLSNSLKKSDGYLNYNPLFREDGWTIIDPFSEMERAQERINKLLKDRLFLYDNHNHWKEDFLSPDIDIHETDKDYIIKIDLPDIKKENIKIEVDDDSLIISGEENYKKTENNKLGFYKKEQRFGLFRKIFPLPHDVKVGSLKTEYKDGYLIVRLKKITSFEQV